MEQGAGVEEEEEEEEESFKGIISICLAYTHTQTGRDTDYVYTQDTPMGVRGTL